MLTVSSLQMAVREDPKSLSKLLSPLGNTPSPPESTPVVPAPFVKVNAAVLGRIWGMGEVFTQSTFTLKRRWQTPCFEKLDQQDWLGGFGVSSHGVRLGVRVNDARLIPNILDRLPSTARRIEGDRAEHFDCVMSLALGGKTPGTRVRKFHLAYHNHTQIARSHSLEDALAAFDRYFAMTVAALAPRKVFIHAGAVGWKGRAIVIPGATLAGKSTLVSELVRAGATYLSDEFAILGPDGRVSPFPKPISMRSAPNARQVDVPVEEFGGRSTRRSLPIGMVLDTSYDTSADWEPKTLSSGEGVLKLLENCPAGRFAPKRVMRVLERVARQAEVVSTRRGEARQVAPMVLKRMEDVSSMAG